jgi:hypothetical protein
LRVFSRVTVHARAAGGVRPEMVRAHSRACVLSPSRGNRRRNSIAADSLPSSLKMARIAAASASVTTNISSPWQGTPQTGKRDEAHEFVEDSATGGEACPEECRRSSVNRHHLGKPLPAKRKQLIRQPDSTIWQGPDRRRSGPRGEQNFSCTSVTCASFERSPTWAPIHTPCLNPPSQSAIASYFCTRAVAAIQA